MEQVYFGIDLGTSSCSVSYVVPARRKAMALQPRVVEFEFGPEGHLKSSRFPSVIARKTTEQQANKAHYGFDAEQANRWSVGRDVFRSIKSHLGTMRSYIQAYTPELNTPVKAWGRLIMQLCNRTRQCTPDSLDPRHHPTILTVPASFGFQQRQETIEAAIQAGFQRDKIRLLDEPVAAMIDWINSPEADLSIQQQGWTNVLVFDFGGGTCDLSLVSVRFADGSPMDLEIKNLAISPYQLLGGDTIDASIMSQLWFQIRDSLQIYRDGISAQDRKRVEDANRLICRSLKHKLCEALAKLTPEQRKQKKWSKISARELLQKTEIDGDQTIAGAVELTPDQFQRLMDPFLNDNGEMFQVGESSYGFPFMGLIRHTLEKAELKAGDLNVILLHGGSCKNPLVRDAMEKWVQRSSNPDRCRVTRTPDLDTSVARGASIHSYHLFHEKRWLVRPIAAEEMGIVTRGDIPETLVDAGTLLPFPETGWQTIRNRFYVSHDNQSRMLIPIFTGRARGCAYPKVVDSRTFKLPEGLKQSHPVEVNLRVDEDKLTHWQFRVAGESAWSQAWSIDNPWIQLRPTDAIEELQAVRGKIRDLVDAGEQVPHKLRVDEAHRTMRAGYPEEAQVLIEEVLDQDPDNAEAWNIKGLILNMRDYNEASCECFAEACRCDDQTAVYRGNYGTALCDLEKYEESVEEMRAALSMGPHLRYLHQWLVIAFEKLEKPYELKKEKERWLEAARQRTSVEPESAAAWKELAVVCTRCGLYTDADAANRKVVELNRTRIYGGSPEDLLAGKAHG